MRRGSSLMRRGVSAFALVLLYVAQEAISENDYGYSPDLLLAQARCAMSAYFCRAI